MNPKGAVPPGGDEAGGPLWTGTPRYRVARCIGQGGMGVVYEAFDLELERAVALKTLPRFDADRLYRFKQEFRTLADVQHANLVRLYELVAPEAGRIFFTMELVPGVDFTRYVRDAGSGARRPPQSAVVTVAVPRPTEAARPPEGESTGEFAKAAPLSPAIVDRLRRAARQLVEGVHALHSAGKVHRDLKPSNVLVTPDGRVVILDFGVATELSRGGRPASSEAGTLMGTVCYMAPEQADADDVVRPASDWYSVGVMLYEALVGRPPFEGAMADVLARKVALDPLPPAACTEGVPADLDALCSALLQRDPDLRPDGAEVLRVLGASRSSVPPAHAGAADEKVGLVGREGHLAALREAFAATRGGRSITVRVAGEPGMGKSATVGAFLDEIDLAGDAIVLRGRAYEREAVPYKAVDAVVDALSRYLRRTADSSAPVPVPEGMAALTKLFPVLHRIPDVAPRSQPPAEDGPALRRRAFGALRALLATLARTAPVVLFIDDAQWGDMDSAPLLAEILRPPDAPPLLLVMTYREDEVDASPFLRELRSRWPLGAEVRDVTIGPLGTGEAERLALSLLGATDDLAQRTARAVAREARGSPFLVEELVRSHRREAGDVTSFVPLTLEQMVSQRLEKLPERVRALVEVVAVGGRPLPLRVVVAASGPESAGSSEAKSSDDTPNASAGSSEARARTTHAVDESLDRLLPSASVRRFVRAGVRDGHEVLEAVHDRIRETVVRLLPDDVLRRHHGRLVSALEAETDTDLEALAVHMLGAGDRRRGARCAERAAEQAASKLAFDQAARLFRWALELASSGGVGRLRFRLAQSLQAAGRASEAADAYRSAARGATGTERLELERSSAEQLLVCGRIGEGVLALRRVLDEVGVSAPRSVLGAVFWLLVYQLRDALGGSGFREREADEVSLENRVRVEALRAVSVGLGIVDVVLGACMQARHLLLAKRIGDRMQVLRAMSVQLVQNAALDAKGSRREQRLFETARGLAEHIGLEGQQYLATTSAIALYMRGRYREALEGLDAADVEIRQFLQRSGSANVPLCATYCCFFLGRLREEARRARLLLVEAQDRGDVYTVVSLRSTVLVDIALAEDDPDTARAHIREAMALWPQRGYHVQHWYAMWSETNVELYSGRGRAARERLHRDLRALKGSFLLRAHFVRGMTAYLRACCAIASAEQEPGARTVRVREARRLARRLERESSPWASTLAALVRAAAGRAAGDLAEAERALRSAVASVEVSGMRLHGWAASHRLGSLLGGQEGDAMVTQAERAMAAEGVRAPARMAALFLPGTWPRT
ncbi:MAG TPA: protein kinase [Polyangiaceae bacterium]|nr:protein kinase [Polyangiaceae bacterium]